MERLRFSMLRNNTAIRCGLVVLAACAAIGNGNAQAPLISLDSVLRAVESHHPELRMYDNQAKAFDLYAEGARSWEAPQVGAGLWNTPYNTGMWRKGTEDGMSRNAMGQVMVSFEQMIPNRQKQRAKEQYMRSMSTVERENRGFQLNRLKSEAKSNYYEWAILKRKAAVLKESENLIQYIISSSQIRYTYNQDKLASLYKAKAQLSQLENDQAMLEAEITRRNIMLNTLMNQEKMRIFEVDTAVTVADYETLPVDTVQVVQNRSDIRALERSIQVNLLNQNLERSRLKPDFGVRYEHMFTFGGQPQMFSLMGMVTLPLAGWSAREFKANARAMEYERRALQDRRQAIANEASGQLGILATEIRSYKRQADTYRTGIIPTLMKNYRANLLAYEQNTEDLFVLLDAWQMLNTARLEYLDKIQNILRLQVDYERELQK